MKNWDTEAYPFSIRPDHPLSVQEIMNLHRDYYAGTEFDRSKADSSGFFASPYRHAGKPKWDRSITAANIAYAWITQTRDDLPCPIFWLSMHAPAESVFLPLAVTSLPEAYHGNDRQKYDADKAWWISGQVTTLTRGYYSAFAPQVLEAARAEEGRSLKLVNDAVGMSAADFAKTLNQNAVRVLSDWRDLHGRLLSDSDCGHNIQYDDSYTPKDDNVKAY